MEFDTTKTLKAFYWDIHGYTSVFVTEVGPHRIEDFSSWWNHFLQQNGPRIFQHNNIHNCQNNQDNKPPSCDIDSSRLECNSIVWGVVHEGIRDDEVFVHLLMYWMFDLVPCAYISEFSGSWKPNFQKRCHSFLVRERTTEQPNCLKTEENLKHFGPLISLLLIVICSHMCQLFIFRGMHQNYCKSIFWVKRYWWGLSHEDILIDGVFVYLFHY